MRTLSWIILGGIFVACGPSVDDTGSAEEEASFRNSVVGIYSSTISPNQPARASQSSRTVYTLRDDGTGFFLAHHCDEDLSDETEFEWSVDPGVERRIRLNLMAPDGSAGSVFWDIPEACSPESKWRRLDEHGNPGKSIEPGRYCNPALSNYSFDDHWECEFELCGDVPEICSGEER